MSHIPSEFIPCHGSFWHWSREGDCIYWSDGPTLCLKEELIFTLEGVDESLIPTPELTLLAVGLRRMETRLAQGMSAALQQFLSCGYDDASMVGNINHQLASMSPLLRTSPSQRILLLCQIQGINKVSRATALAFLRTQPDQTLSRKFSLINIRESARYLNEDLREILENSDSFPGLLKTGSSNPQKLREKVNLFRMLEKSARFRPAARFAARLIPLIASPVQIGRSVPVGIGGISDITNRGKYEDLTPVELAYDNDVSVTRMIHGEALYYRRESTPAPKPSQRYILVDTGIFSWGKYRILNACLALALSSGAGSLTSSRVLTTTDDSQMQEAEFPDMTGWEEFLANMHANPDPLKAWVNWIRSTNFNAGDEIYLISHESCSALTGLAAQLQQAMHPGDPLVYQVYVTREYALTVKKLNGRNFDILVSARLNAEDIEALTENVTREDIDRSSLNTPATLPAIPAYFQKLPYLPFYYPADPAAIRNYSLNSGQDQLAGISHFRELYYWRHSGLPARILDAQCPEPVAGKIHLHGKYVSLVFKPVGASQYYIRHYLLSGSTSAAPRDIAIKHIIPSPTAVEFQPTALVVKTKESFFAVNYFSGDIIHEQSMKNILGAGWVYSASPHWGLHKKNPGRGSEYSETPVSAETANAMIGKSNQIINPIRIVGDPQTRMPVIQTQSGSFWKPVFSETRDGMVLEWVTTSKPEAVSTKSRTHKVPENLQAYIKVMEMWESGLFTYIDRHGAVHFSGREIPQHHLSVMTIIGIPTVAWQPEHQFFGNSDLLWGEPARPFTEIQETLEIIGQSLTL